MSDHHEGQRVSRRSVFAGVGSVGLGTLLAACGSQAGGSTTVTTSTGESASVTPQTATDAADLFAGTNTCTLTPDTTQGPYYFDADKIRGDIREDRQGARLRLALKVQDSETCAALPNAVVEIWHCDAAGLYSGAEDQSSGGGGTPPGPPPGGGDQPPGEQPGGGDQDLVPTDDKRYLRGAQVSNAEGVVEFTTIWPGWYRGRTVHVHVMVHVSNERVLTSQLMFDEELNAAVFAQRPYAAHTGRDTFNDGDTIFEDAMLLKVVPDGDGHLASIVLSADSDQDGA